MFTAWHDGRERYARRVAQTDGKVGGVVDATLVERIQFPQLHDAYRTLSIRHAEVVAAVVEVLPPEPPAHREARLVQRAVFGAPTIHPGAVRAVEGHSLEHGRVIGHDHPAFSESGHVPLL